MPANVFTLLLLGYMKVFDPVPSIDGYPFVEPLFVKESLNGNNDNVTHCSGVPHSEHVLLVGSISV
jgi:hypothetical protein